TDLATVLADDDGRADFVGAGPVQRGEVSLATRSAGALDRADVRHADALEPEEHELDERVARELLQLAEHRAARRFAVTLDGGEGILLEADEVRAERPVRERDARARGEAEARTLTVRLTAKVVGTERRRQLRVREHDVAADAPAAHERIDDGA